MTAHTPVVFLTTILLATAAPPATAGAFPGENGRVVYVAGDDVFTVAPDGTDLVNLTNAPGLDAANPSASPDGRRIAFNVTSSTVRSAAGLYVMNANGTGLRDVLAGRHDDFVEVGAVTWSPNGRRLAFEAFSYPAFRNELFVVGVDGRGPRRITNCDCVGGSYPVWSPVAPEIAFVPCCGNAVATVDVRTGDTTDVYVSPSDEPSNLTWSPDGMHLAFDHLSEVYRVPVAGGQPIDLTSSGAGYYSNPSWSPDGTKILVESNHSSDTGNQDLYAIDAAGGIEAGIERITTALDAESQPEWAPLCESRCTPTSIRMRVRKDERRVIARGRVEPAVEGRVRVTLFRRERSGWRRVARKAPRFDDGRFTVRFRRVPARGCRIQARYGGDDDHEGSRVAKRFAC